MNSVFIVQHLHTLPQGEADIKIIGIYRSIVAARAAVDKVKGQAGFCDHPNLVNPESDDDSQGFYIDEYVLDKDHWEDGFTTE